jgi:hypothetical protein
LRAFTLLIGRRRILVAVLLILGARAPIDAAFASEYAAVLELGGAGEWGLKDSTSQFGPTARVRGLLAGNGLEYILATTHWAQ